MKKYPSMFGVLAALLLVASFIVPSNLITPSPVEADPGLCKWDTLTTPGVIIGRWDLGYFPVYGAWGGTDTVDMAVGGDGNTILMVTRTAATVTNYPPANILLWSSNNGISFSASLWANWRIEWDRLFPGNKWFGQNIYLVAIAPDNPNVIAIVSDDPDLGAGSGPRELWITTNRGGKWEVSNLRKVIDATEYVRAIDISIDYGGKRDIAVATVDGTGGGDIYVLPSTGFTGWQKQNFDKAPLGPLGDFMAVKFSPTYSSDGALVVVYADINATIYNISLRDINRNQHRAWAFPNPAYSAGPPGVEVKDPASPMKASPAFLELWRVDLELPSDFSGQAASLRRVYISLDAWGSRAAGSCEDGIYRIDDTTVYELMDTTNTPNKAIYSIAYYGTFASGKLLAGEMFGDPCTATVPTWFTDAPTTCPIPCWYPALKPTTGAACLATKEPCAAPGYGDALVAWRSDGQLAFAVTGGLPQQPSNFVTSKQRWFDAFNGPLWLDPPAYLDESALSVSRNNGETWNQIAVIDTYVYKFTDVAPSADGKTIYLASVNPGTTATAPRTSVAVTWNVTCNETGLIINSGPTITVTPSSDQSCNATVPSFTPTITGQYDGAKCQCNYTITIPSFDYECACNPDCDKKFAGLTVTGSIACSKTFPVGVAFTLDCCGCLNCEKCCPQEIPCCAFDSVWRTSANSDVVAPYPALSPGTFWERILTHVTAVSCKDAQSDLALLRLVPYCQDETGQIVAWAAQKTTAAMWSPDYGDYWAVITPRNVIQDFTFESKTVLYFLSPTGLVQKMPYTGTAWATTLSDVNSWMSAAHTIAAYPEGKVLVGAAAAYHSSAYAASLSQNFNTDNPSFAVLSTLLRSPYLGNVHVAFHPNFKDNKTFFLADDPVTLGGGSVYRSTPGALGTGDQPLPMSDMMAATNGAVGCNAPHPVGQYGIVLSFTGEALYSAHGNVAIDGVACGVDRTIDDGTGKFGPLSGMPKPGVAWDCLNVFVNPPLTERLAPRTPCFTLEPSSLKISGCCTAATDSTLWAIDDALYVPNAYYPNYATAYRSGFVWAFTDCMAKKGPKLVTADKTLIGCDAPTGRAGEVNLCWEQLCVASGYDIEVAKSPDFSILVLDLTTESSCGSYKPTDVTKPCAFIPAGGKADWYEGSAIARYGQLECGHTYYWRVKVRECATGQTIRSPWSEVRSFSVKAGVPVSAPFQGIQPFAPANGATNVSIKNPGFSWAPMGDTTKYEFVLAEDAAMTKVVKQATVSGTAYAYEGNLKYSTNYFWKVRPVEPAPGDWSPVFVFTTEPQPAPPPPPEKPAPTPLWVWVVIAIGAILVIVTLVLIFKTRRV